MNNDTERMHGTLIANRYRLKEYKGSGSFGEVWLAEDTMLGIEVAVKLYIALDQKGMEEFANEFKVSCELVHQNLLTPKHYDVWEHRPYLVMKFCARGSASNLSDNATEKEIWTFIRDVASGLSYLHAQNPPIVHQDIKPENILIDNDGRYLITDFGISKKMRNTMRKQSGRAAMSGAVAYMAPERFLEEPVVAKANDIFSLGVSIYELATGELPFNGQGGGMLNVGAELPRLSSPKWSADLNQVMRSCLSKDPWDRPTAEKLAELAQKKLNGERVAEPPKEQPTPPPASPPTPKPDSTSKIMLWFLVPIIVAAMAGWLSAISRQDRIRERYSETQIESSSVGEETEALLSLSSSSSSSENAITVEPSWTDVAPVQEPEASASTVASSSFTSEGTSKPTPSGSVAETRTKPTSNDNTSSGISEASGNGGTSYDDPRRTLASSRYEWQLEHKNYTETVFGIDMQMVWVEGGTFMMGATSEQGNSYDPAERPTHDVTLTSYYIGKYEVSQAQWKAVMGTKPSYFTGDNLPVENITWHQAKEFCDKLSAKTGKKYALPTEAQWEFAARGGVKSKGYKYSGSNMIGDVAWYYKNSNSITHAAVGIKAANELEIYDMSGNVWEWCADWYGSYSSYAVRNPTGPKSGYKRVLRGGSWDSGDNGCRVSRRNSYEHGGHSSDFGFRVVCLP